MVAHPKRTLWRSQQRLSLQSPRRQAKLQLSWLVKACLVLVGYGSFRQGGGVFVKRALLHSESYPQLSDYVMWNFVESDGRIYKLSGLLASLTSMQLQEIEEICPRSGQEAWDYAVRRWPTMTASLIASSRFVVTD